MFNYRALNTHFLMPGSSKWCKNQWKRKVTEHPVIEQHVGETGAGCNTFFLYNWSYYYLHYSAKATKVDFIWKGHLPAWFSFGFEVEHACSFKVVNAIKQGVKCCNKPHTTGSVATLPGDSCNTVLKYTLGRPGSVTTLLLDKLYGDFIIHWR